MLVPKWEISMIGDRIRFMPTDLDTTGFRDVTEMKHGYIVYMARDGTIHDGAVYAAQAERESRR